MQPAPPKPSPFATCRAASIWAALCLIGGAADAQDDAPDVPALARRLRTAELDAAERRAVVDGLLAAGEAGARSLFTAVRLELRRLDDDFHDDRARHLRAFERYAPQVIRQRQGRRGARRVEELRAEVLSHSRGGELSKALIRTELDPRLAELEELCTVTPAQVLAAVDALGAQDRALRELIDLLLARFVEQERAEEVLLRSDSGERYLGRFELAPDPRGHRAELDAAQQRLAFRATPMSGRDRDVLDENAALAADPDNGLLPGEVAGVRAANRIRLLLGIGALVIDPKLCNAARDHSRDMVRLGFFAHTSPVPGKETFGQRAARAGTSASAENIAAGRSTGEGAIRGWWYSPGHHRNMLGRHSRVGLGRHQGHWTQMLGG